MWALEAVLKDHPRSGRFSSISYGNAAEDFSRHISYLRPIRLRDRTNPLVPATVPAPITGGFEMGAPAEVEEEGGSDRKVDGTGGPVSRRELE